MRKSRPYSPSYCNGCGGEIRWVRGKGQKTSVPVEPQGMYFLPTPDGTAFVMTNGRIQYGRIAADGILGYRQHACEAYSRRVLSEDDLARRCWA